MSWPLTRRTASTLAVALLLTAGSVVARAEAAPPAAAKVPINSCWSTDHGRPVVDDVQVEPDHVDVTEAPETVAFTVTAHDTGGPGPATGVQGVTVAASTGDLPLTLGDDGLWRGELTIPEGQPGDVSYWVHADDAAGQGGGAFTDAHRTITVTSHPDTEAPRLTDLTVSDHSVDTRERPASVVVTVTAPDQGVGGTTWVALIVRGKGRSDPKSPLPMVQVPGTDRFQLAVPVPRFSGDHRWHIGVMMDDRFGNDRWIHFPSLADRGGWFDVRSGPRDQQPPRVADVQRWTRRLDVRDGKAALHVRALLTDDDGIREAGAYLGGSGIRVSLHRISGSTRHGIWEGQAPVPVCGIRSEKLTGRVWAIDQHDNGARSHRLASQIVAKDRVAPEAYRRFPHGDRSRVDLTFDEDVTGISTGGVQVYSWPQAQEKATVADGTWTCRNAQDAPTPCATGWVRTARFVADDEAAYLEWVDWAPEHHLDVRDRHGNPITVGTELVLD